MHKSSKNSEEPKQYADVLKKVDKQAKKVLKEVSEKKSKKWDKEVRYMPDRIWLCHLNHPEKNNLCKSNCADYNICQNYKLVRDFFLPYGYVVYPYTLSINNQLTSKAISKNIKSLGFYDDSIENTLFINSVCFTESFKDHPMYSALNESVHEFLHAKADDFIEYDLLMASPNHEVLVRYLSEPDYLEKLLVMYDVDELKTTNEPIHRFIANNKETKCLLDALFKRVKHYIPPPEYADLFWQLDHIFEIIDN